MNTVPSISNSKPGSELHNKLMQEFLIQSELTSKSSYKKYVQIAREFLKQVDNEEAKKFFDSNDLLDSEEFIFPENFSDKEKFELICCYDTIVIAVINTLNNYTPQFLNFKGLKRQSCPPIEAFTYVGHSELDIKQSKVSYSYLF